MKQSDHGKILYLIGFMGSGKTTVGKTLAAELGLPFFDMDSMLEERFGTSISEVFAEKGEAYFRDEESRLLKSIPDLLTASVFSSTDTPFRAVCSCGGGAALSAENRGIMHDTGSVIHLYVSPEEAASRLAGDSSRPVLAGKSPEEVRFLMEKRLPLYEEAADHTVETDRRTPEDISAEIISFLKHQ